MSFLESNYANKNDIGNLLVTIICVSKNAEKTIQNLINSIEAIKTSSIEFIVTDGASTDNTVQILKGNSKTINYWRSEPDSGIYNAMNKSIKLANGKWILFMGADDVLLHGFTAMLSYLKNEKTIYYGGVIFHDKKNILSKTFDSYSLTKLNICQQCIFYPKTVFDRYQFNKIYPICADYDLNMKCWHDTEFTFQFKDFLIADHASGGISSQERDLNFLKNRTKLYKKYLGAYAFLRYKNRTFGFMSVIKSLLIGDY